MANNNDKKAGKRMTKQDMTNVLFDFFHVGILTYIFKLGLFVACVYSNVYSAYFSASIQ